MHAIEAHGLERVAILDFDVHHGNGTESAFHEDPRVMLCSTFQHPYYPYSGADSGNEHIINVPLPAMTDGTGFRDAVSFDAVLDTIRIAHRAASSWGMSAPRIAVAGLNPHAGEGGLFGSEEAQVIAPAIAAARAEGIDASGPYAPDTVFMRARNAAGHPGEFGIVVAMTHDHGLIPVKYLGVEQGVNVTLGLPFVRTSPDHGTAFDIAGTGRADASSFAAAVRMARRLA